MAEQSPSTAATTRTANATKRSTAAKKAAATRSRRQAATARQRSAAAQKAAETRRELAKTPVDRAQEYAERAVLIPFGAALTARDKAVAAVEGLASSFSDREKAEKELAAQLKRFERRGRTERNRVERRVKRTRTRVERELRRRRTRVEREIRSTTKGVGSQADLLTARVENLVQSGITRGTQVATKVQERFADVA